MRLTMNNAGVTKPITNTCQILTKLIGQDQSKLSTRVKSVANCKYKISPLDLAKVI